jgi:hypothetical protein
MSNACNLLTLPYLTKDLPYLVCMLFSWLLCLSMTYSTQYNTHGVVKEFAHPNRLRVLRLKSSYADVVSPVLIECVPYNDFVGISWC